MSDKWNAAYTMNEATEAYVERYRAELLNYDPTKSYEIIDAVVSTCCLAETQVLRESPPTSPDYLIVRCTKCRNACQVIGVEPDENEPEEEIDHEDTLEPICPHCGHAQDNSDGQFYEQDEREHDCESCGETFLSFGTPTWTWETMKAPTPDQLPEFALETWETDHVPVFSVQHVTVADLLVLTRIAKEQKHFIAEYDEGYFIWIGGDGYADNEAFFAKNLSVAACLLFKTLAAKGAEFVRLDSEAPVCSLFKVHD